MVTHDTKCSYWDKVSSKTQPSKSTLSGRLLFVKRFPYFTHSTFKLNILRSFDVIHEEFPLLHSYSLNSMCVTDPVVQVPQRQVAGCYPCRAWAMAWCEWTPRTPWRRSPCRTVARCWLQAVWLWWKWVTLVLLCVRLMKWESCVCQHHIQDRDTGGYKVSPTRSSR